jgi:hypothetical protein
MVEVQVPMWSRNPNRVIALPNSSLSFLVLFDLCDAVVSSFYRPCDTDLSMHKRSLAR